jgi:hypothetical protein
MRDGKHAFADVYTLHAIEITPLIIIIIIITTTKTRYLLSRKPNHNFEAITKYNATFI